MDQKVMYDIGQEVYIRKDLSVNRFYEVLCTAQMVFLSGTKTKVISWTNDNNYKLEIDGGANIWHHNMLTAINKDIKMETKSDDKIIEAIKEKVASKHLMDEITLLQLRETLVRATYMAELLLERAKEENSIQ